ncbi:TolC family protein [Spirulina major]|uniref:TolC family protein n=1 Tax=Spirulina major TaxID=270636 RepID=UPI000933E9E2|nr:TolC family protein [Spirulina major]
MSRLPLPSWLHHTRLLMVATISTIVPLTVIAQGSPPSPSPESDRDRASALTSDPLTLSDSPELARTVPPSSPSTPPHPSLLQRIKTTLGINAPDSPAPATPPPNSTADRPLASRPAQRDRVSSPRSDFDPVALFRSPAPPRLPAQSSTPVSPNATGVPLTLNEAIALTVLHNTQVRNQYLDRIVDRARLRTAEGELLPKFTPMLMSGVVDNVGGQGTRTEVRAAVSWFTPTRGTLSVDWRSQLNSVQDTEDSQGFSVTYRHPLLRYGESAIAHLDRRRALMRDDINQLTLRQTLIDEVTDTIRQYRSLLLAQEQVTLTQTSLTNAEQQLQRQRALVAAGREARSSLFRTEQNVADFQSQLLAARNAVQSAQLALMNQLGINRDLDVVAIADPNTAPPNLDPPTLEQVSLAQRPDYLSGQLGLRIATLDLRQADNNRRWNLDLETQYNDATAQPGDWSAQMILTRRLGDRRRDHEAFEASRVELLKQENNLAQLEADIRIAVRNQIRQVQLQAEQLQLARRAVDLAQQELAAQEALVQAGRGDAFQLQEAQRQLLTVRNNELQQRVNYLNAIAELDQVQGITLDRWGIQLDPAQE